jgi:hypothetical protein
MFPLQGSHVVGWIEKWHNFKHIALHCFFQRFQKYGIDIFFSDIAHLIDFEVAMSNKWLDFMLVHIFAQNVISNRDMYLLLNAQAYGVLQNEIQNGGGSKQWGTK